MKLEIDFSKNFVERLRLCADARSVTVEALVHAYVEDWLSIDYPEALGRRTRRGIHRDGPIAFDPEAAEAAALVEREIPDLENRRSGNGSN